MKKGFKVLRGNKSCIVNRYEGIRTYWKGKVTVPKAGYGPLCVFSSRTKALNFFPSKVNRVVPCNYEPSKHTSVWYCGYLHPNGDRLGPHHMKLENLPEGTCLADSVTCLE